MEKERIFQILGIEETKDEASIRLAYRKKLAVTHPEDNPEGFKRLREAYEEALSLAKKEDIQIIEEDEVSNFIRRLDALYQSLPQRLDVEQWKALFAESIFDDLELGERAKWQVFSYLSEHYRIPAYIWAVLGGRFAINANEQEFKEHLPSNFVDFVIWKSSEEGAEGEFPFFYFEGEDRADYDGFLNDYNELTNLFSIRNDAEDQEHWKKVTEEKIAGMDSYGISHPWFTMQKAKYKLILGKKDEAVQTVYELWERYDEDMHLRRDGAIILAECNEEEEAEKAFLTFFEGNQDKNMVFDAHVELTRIYLRQNKILEAREHILDASDIYNNTVVEDLLTSCNTRMIEQYTLREETLTVEEGIRLAWGYIQTRRGKEGYNWFKEHPVLTEDSAACHRAKAVLYLIADHAQEALKEARLWQKAQPMEEKKDPYREAQSYEVKGRCLVTLYHDSRRKMEEAEKNREPKIAEEERKKSWMFMDSAIRAFNEALKRQPEDINFCMSKMLFCRDLEDYEAMEEMCLKIISLDRSFFWGPFYIQEAYEKLGKAQEVVDYFYAAKAIYAGRPEIYERAARVFAAFNQYSEVENILRQADQAEIDSTYLKIKRLELKRRNAKEVEDYRKADTYADEVINELEEKKKAGEEIPNEWLADAYMQRAYLQDEAPREVLNGEILSQCITRAMQLEDSLRSRYFWGRYCLEYKNNADGAYANLKICEERGMEFEWLDYYLARCEEYFQHWENAISYYKKAMEKNPNEIDFAWRIGQIYQRKFSRLGQKEYYDEALKYLDIQTERFGADPEDLWLYAALYIDNREYELSLKKIEQAMEKSQGIKFWGRKGQLLRLLGQSKEALACLEKAIELGRMNDQDYGFGYAQINKLFWGNQEYERGVIWFFDQMEAVKTPEQKRENLEYIMQLYIYLGKLTPALDIIGKINGGISLEQFVHSSWDEEADRIVNLLSVYRKCLSGRELKAKVDEAAKLMHSSKAKKHGQYPAEKRRIYIELADTYTDYLLEEGKGLYYAQKAFQLIEGEGVSYSFGIRIIRRIMGILWRQGRIEESRTYQKLFWERIETVYAEGKELNKTIEELYTEDQRNQKNSLYDMFLLAFYSGEYDKAKAYLNKMERGKWCWDCSHQQCTEEWECKGYWALHQKEKEQALMLFRKALEADAGNADAIRELGLLEKEEKDKPGKLGNSVEAVELSDMDIQEKGFSGFMKRLFKKEK